MKTIKNFNNFLNEGVIEDERQDILNTTDLDEKDKKIRQYTTKWTSKIDEIIFSNEISDKDKSFEILRLFSSRDGF